MRVFSSTDDSVQISAFNSTPSFYHAQFRSQAYDDVYEQQPPPFAPQYLQQPQQLFTTQHLQQQQQPPQPQRRPLGIQEPQAAAADRAMGSISRTAGDLTIEATNEELRLQVQRLSREVQSCKLVIDDLTKEEEPQDDSINARPSRWQSTISSQNVHPAQLARTQRGPKSTEASET